MRRSAVLLALGFSIAASGRAAGAVSGNVCQLLPVVLDVEAAGTRYRTEISVSNPDGLAQELTVLYTASLGLVGGTGEGRFSVPAGGQVFVRDGIDYLRQLGIGVQASSASAPQAGTLRICRLNPAQAPVGVMARITSPTRPPAAPGNAGVSFAAVPADEGLTKVAIVFGVRQSPLDRSNVAIYNPGAEPVSVKLVLRSGTSDREAVISAKEELPGYGWKQFSGISSMVPAIDQGYVLVERISSAGVFGAYGVVNDNETNDGSFIPAVAEGELGGTWTIPVLVDSPAYRSELILANSGVAETTFSLAYVDSMTHVGTPRSTRLTLPAGRQVIVPDVFELFRSGASSNGGETSAGTLRVAALEGEVRGAFAGVRVLTRSEMGRFGVFAPTVPPGSEVANEGYLFGLRSDAQTRSNVAVLNPSASAGEAVSLQLQVVDGATGQPAGAPLSVTLAPGEWAQPAGFFAAAGVAYGDVRIVRTAGQGAWSAYGVVNDGAVPGVGTGDGSFVAAVLSSEAPNRLPDGTWGADGVKMWVDATGIAIETDCAHGNAIGPVYLDAQGRFSAGGTWSFEGGPTPVGGFPAHVVVFSGQVEKGRMTLSIRFVIASVSNGVRLTATQGVSPLLRKCL